MMKTVLAEIDEGLEFGTNSIRAQKISKRINLLD